MPILALGATGPVAADKRRPWIDWIHTAKDQGALLRNFTKWDDEPRSPEAIVEGMLKAYQMATTPPYGPVYVCLDAGPAGAEARPLSRHSGSRAASARRPRRRPPKRRLRRWPT